MAAQYQHTFHKQTPSHDTGAIVTATKTPQELSPQVYSLVELVRQFGLADSWSDLNEVLTSFDDDAVYDASFVWVPGKNKIRAICSVFGFFGKVQVEPKVIEIRMLDERNVAVSVEKKAVYHVNRHWFLPVTYLMPDIPVHGVCSMGVRGWNDKVNWMKDRHHNLPTLPWVVRAPIGWTLGMAASLFEPVVLRLSEWWDQGVEQSYKVAGLADHDKSIMGQEHALGHKGL